VTQQEQGQQAAILYAEKGSALRWPYYFHPVLWTCVLAIGVAGLILNPGLAFVPAIGTVALVISAVIIGANFRTGIQVSADGIRIGAVSHGRRRPRRNLPWGDAQRKEVFFCPWNAVLRAAVVTDRTTLKDAGRLRGPAVKLGVLWAPFAKAALLIQIDPRYAVFPQFREPDEKRPIFRAYHPGPFHPSPIWYAPTKRPEELRAVLAQHVAPARYESSLSTHPYLFEKEDVTLPR
jgi:hypothetical protein